MAPKPDQGLSFLIVGASFKPTLSCPQLGWSQFGLSLSLWTCLVTTGICLNLDTLSKPHPEPDELTRLPDLSSDPAHPYGLLWQSGLLAEPGYHNCTCFGHFLLSTVGKNHMLVKTLLLSALFSSCLTAPWQIEPYNPSQCTG